MQVHPKAVPFLPKMQKRVFSLLVFLCIKNPLFALPEMQLSQSQRLCLSPRADATGSLWIRDSLRVRHYRLWAKKSVWKKSNALRQKNRDASSSLLPLHTEPPIEEFLFGKTLETPEFRIFRKMWPENAFRFRSSYWFYAEKAGRPLSKDEPLPFLHPDVWASDIFPELLFSGCLLQNGRRAQTRLRSSSQGNFLQAKCPGALPDLRLIYADTKASCPKKALRYDAEGRLQKILYFTWRPLASSVQADENPDVPSSKPIWTLQNLRLYFGRHPREIGIEWD